MWRVGIDAGGTFTDFFAWNEDDGSYKTAEVPTTKDDRSRGVRDSIETAGIPFDQLSFLKHGTTIATNSLIERDDPDAAFVPTEGFRDTIEIGRQHRRGEHRARGRTRGQAAPDGWRALRVVRTAG